MRKRYFERLDKLINTYGGGSKVNDVQWAEDVAKTLARIFPSRHEGQA